jgi:hypothetical protein
MAVKNPTEAFIKIAELMDDESAEKVLSRMSGKLPKRFKKEKLTKVEAIAIQLELEDELLQEWRKNYSEIKMRLESKQKKSKSK